MSLRDKNLISKSLKTLREKKNISQTQLSIRLKSMGVCISQQKISRIENNQCRVKDYELICLCIALDEKPEKLIDSIPIDDIT